MKVKNVTKANLLEALKVVNKEYDGNIRFKKLEPVGRHFSFTLTVENSAKAGARHRTSANEAGKYRRISAACWHVHGDYFDALFEIEPKAVIRSSGSNGVIVIDATQGNWQDRKLDQWHNRCTIRKRVTVNKKTAITALTILLIIAEVALAFGIVGIIRQYELLDNFASGIVIVLILAFAMHRAIKNR